MQANKKCHWCHVDTELTDTVHNRQATIDHIVPRYKGGGNESSNLVSACRNCNARRNKEDSLGMVEGSLLGRFRLAEPRKQRLKATEVLRTQRDQAVARVLVLEQQVMSLQQQVAALNARTAWQMALLQLRSWWSQKTR